MDSLINKAKAFAIAYHQGQTYGENEFIFHPLQVMSLIMELKPDDSNLICASVLHDILENCPTVSYEILRNEFNEDVANLVKEVTKGGYNTFPNLHTHRGVILKFADRLCNLSNMSDWSKERKQKYIEKSRFWK